MTKNLHPWAELLVGFWDFRAQPVARGGHTHTRARNFEFFKIGENQACRYSTCRSQCPEHEDNFLFEIGPKMTKLWTKNVCPYMDASPNFDLIMAPECPK